MPGTVFILKPIVDALYEEMKVYASENESMKKRIEELEAEVAKLKKSKERVVLETEDDDIYAEAALAPPTSSPAIILKQEEKEEVKVVNGTATQDDSKQISVNVEKNRKEYMKEYQRSYRKKQKNIIMNS